MFIPKNMRMPAGGQTWSFIKAHSFGVMITPDLTATHLPFVVREQEGQLLGHLAKANPQWRDADGQRVLVIFSGPHSYISPRWYASKPNVPTWNYAAVHAYGTLELVEDEANLAAMMALVETYDPGLTGDKSIISDDYVNKLSGATTGFRIQVDTLEGKEKLNQHKSQADQQGVYQALQQLQDTDALALANYMKSRQLGTGE